MEMKIKLPAQSGGNYNPGVGTLLQISEIETSIGKFFMTHGHEDQTLLLSRISPYFKSISSSEINPVSRQQVLKNPKIGISKGYSEGVNPLPKSSKVTIMGVSKNFKSDIKSILDPSKEEAKNLPSDRELRLLFKKVAWQLGRQVYSKECTFIFHY